MKKKIAALSVFIVIIAMFVGGAMVGCSAVEDVVGDNLAVNAKIISCTDGNAKGLVGVGSWKASNSATQSVEIALAKNSIFNTIVLKESGFNIKQFSIYAYVAGGYKLIYRNDKIETMRYCSFDDVATDKVKLEVSQADDNFSVKSLQIFYNAKAARPFVVNEYVSIESPTIFTDMINKQERIDMLNTVTDVTFMGGLGLKSDGTVGYYLDDKARFEREFAAFFKIVGNRNIKIHLNVYSNNEDISSILDTYADKIITQYLELAAKYNLVGFDIDWEYPSTPQQWTSYSKFLIKLKEAIAPKGLTTMIAISSWCNGLSKKAIEAVDLVNVMIYDGKDRDGYHASFEAFVHNATAMLNKGYSKQQLLLGLPFYGRDTSGSGCLVNYIDIQAVDEWGNVAKDYVFVDKQGVAKTVDIAYNGFAMIRDKTTYSYDFGYAGVMTWQFISDKTFDNKLSLHHAMAQAITSRK